MIKQFDIDEASKDEYGFYAATEHHPDDPFLQNIHVIEAQPVLDLLDEVDELTQKLSYGGISRENFVNTVTTKIREVKGNG